MGSRNAVNVATSLFGYQLLRFQLTRVCGFWPDCQLVMNVKTPKMNLVAGLGIERVSETDLERRWGVRISRRGINLINVTTEEGIHLQRYPLVNGPDPALTRRLWRKLADPGNWRVVEREPGPLEIEVHWTALGFAEWTISLLPESASRVLIAGSMDGHEPMLLRAARPDREYRVLDLLPEHAARLRRRGFIACVMDLYRLAYAPRSFDAVYNNNVMEHLYNDLDECLTGIREILRPGGTFVCVMPTETNATNPDAEWQAVHVGRSHDWWLVDPGHPWKSDLHDIQVRLLAAGFERPTFAYFAENLAHAAACARARARGRAWVWLEGLCRLVGGSLLLQQIEARLRAATGFYGYLGVRRRVRYQLRLPNRQTDTLQVAVVARRPS